MLYKTYDYNINMYSLYCKLDNHWKKNWKKNRQVYALSSYKNTLQDKEVSVVSFISLFITVGALPKKICLRKPTSFFRSRSIQFWGYESFVSGKNFYDIMFNIRTNIFKKNFDYGFLKKTGFFFGRKKSIGFPNISILDELSETSFYQYRKKFGVSLKMFPRSKNYINVYPYS